MTKKEINEIKGLFDIDECNISRLCGLYVDGEKNKVTKLNETFLNIPEEEQYKYFEIFKKTLSGTPGKNLLDMEFLDLSDDENNAKSFFKKLRDSELKDEALLDEFYDKVIANYDYVGNYLILLIYQAYDVPGITNDNIGMDDASETMYRFLLCSICPVSLSKPGLGYDESLNTFHNQDRSYMVDLTETGFLYPAFNERCEDEEGLLFYSKNISEFQSGLIDKVLMCHKPIPAARQQKSFQALVADTLGDECDYQTVKNIHDNLNNMMQDKGSEAGPTILDKDEVRRLFKNSGVSEDKLEAFDEKFKRNFEIHPDNNAVYDPETGEIISTGDVSGATDESGVDGTGELGAGDDGVVADAASLGESSIGATNNDNAPVEPAKILASNIIPSKKFEVKTADVVVRINSDKTNLVETRVIDGQKCLVIKIDEGLIVNGIPVNKA